MEKTMTFTEGNLFKKMNVYAIPLILSGFLQLLFNACDLIVCGQFGSDNSVGAISSTTSLINLIVNAFIGISIGSNVLMARAYGVKDKVIGQKVVYTSMFFSLIVGVIVAIFGFVFSRKFLVMLDTDSSLIDLSTTYLKIYFIGVFFMIVYNFGAALLRAVGETKKPFIFLTIAGIVNVIFNLVFVLGFNMDVAGVATATVISQVVSSILVIIALFRNKNFFTFKLKDFRPYKREAINIFRIGIPAALQSIIFNVSNVLIQSSINSLGTSVINGSGASSSIEGFISTSMEQTSNTCIAFVSANAATHNYKNVKKVVIFSLLMIIMYNVFFSGIALTFSESFLKLYISSSESIAYGKQRLTIMASTYFMCGFMDVLASAIRGINYQVLPTIVTLFGICGTRLIFIYVLFPQTAFHSLSAIVWSYPASWIITAIVHFICFIVLYKKLVKIDIKNKLLKRTA